jgi:hypothetical protein
MKMSMPELDFKIEGAEATKFSATPEIALRLRITSTDASRIIHTVALRCQIQIEVARRQYAREDQKKLGDLFGEPGRWSQTLRNLLWMHVSVNVPQFQGMTIVELPVPCTFDFNVAATKYFFSLGDGDVPLLLLFSGTVFHSSGDKGLQVAPIGWDKETRFSLPVRVWREMMDVYYPGSAWLCLGRDVFARLYEYKVRRGIPTWDQTLESMLRSEETVIP